VACNCASHETCCIVSSYTFTWKPIKSFSSLLLTEHEGKLKLCSYEKMWFELLCDHTLQSPCITQLVYTSWLARNESAFVAVTYKEDKPQLNETYLIHQQSYRQIVSTRKRGNARLRELLTCSVLLVRSITTADELQNHWFKYGTLLRELHSWTWTVAPAITRRSLL